MFLDAIASPAKLKILEILCQAQSPLNLRALIDLSGFSPRPIQLAVQQLESLNFVSIEGVANRKSISLGNVPKSLKEFFKAVELEEIATKSQGYQKRGKTLLRFQTEAHEFARRMKKNKKKK